MLKMIRRRLGHTLCIKSLVRANPCMHSGRTNLPNATVLEVSMVNASSLRSDRSLEGSPARVWILRGSGEICYHPMVCADAEV